MQLGLLLYFECSFQVRFMLGQPTNIDGRQPSLSIGNHHQLGHLLSAISDMRIIPYRRPWKMLLP